MLYCPVCRSASRRDAARNDVGECGHAELDRGGLPLLGCIDLGELVIGAGEADLQAFDFAGPALAFGFGDAVVQVGADLLEPGALGWLWPQERASDTGMLMDAGRAEGAGADADGQLAFFEVGEELVPLLLGRCPVFLAGAGVPAAGDEAAVGFDGLGAVDRLVAHRGADVAVAADDLGDVRRQPVDDRVGDENPAEIMRVKTSGWPSWARMPVPASARWRISRSAPSLMGRCSPKMARWN